MTLEENIQEFWAKNGDNSWPECSDIKCRCPAVVMREQAGTGNLESSCVFHAGNLMKEGTKPVWFSCPNGWSDIGEIHCITDDAEA